MVSEDAATKILVYLKKQGQTNTFKLATELCIDRNQILNIIKKLEGKQAVEVKSGIVYFLKFPRKEKKVVEKVIKKIPKPKKKVKHKKTVLETIQAENIRLKEKILELQNLPPKIIRRTKVEKIIQKVPVKSEKLEEQTEHIKELEEKIKELQSAPPKIIRRTIVKKVPVKVKEEIPKKEEIKPRKFKLPKISLSGLGKSIKRLHVPEMLRK